LKKSTSFFFTLFSPNDCQKTQKIRKNKYITHVFFYIFSSQDKKLGHGTMVDWYWLAWMLTEDVRRREENWFGFIFIRAHFLVNWWSGSVSVQVSVSVNFFCPIMPLLRRSIGALVCVAFCSWCLGPIWQWQTGCAQSWFMLSCICTSILLFIFEERYVFSKNILHNCFPIPHQSEFILKIFSLFWKFGCDVWKVI
jgi:hypothetical protein